MDKALEISIETNLIKIDLLHPEILSTAQLVQVLIENRVPEIYCQDTDKVKLLDLFQRVVLPLPQRIHRKNRRGNLLAKTQKKEDNGHQEMSAKSHVNILEPNLGSSKLTCLSILKPHIGEGRLKFPPCSTDFKEKKIIKISSQQTAKQSINYSSSSQKEIKNHKIINLINNHLSSAEKKSLFENNLSHKRISSSSILEENDTPKKKHKPITWP